MSVLISFGLAHIGSVSDESLSFTKEIHPSLLDACGFSKLQHCLWQSDAVIRFD